MAWQSTFERHKTSREKLKSFRENILSFGVEFLDRALKGIMKSDLILIGAPSGVGKTAFVVNLALANALAGKKVHLFALEAYKGEIEHRLEFRFYSTCFFNDPDRTPNTNINYESWVSGELDDVFKKYDSEVTASMEKIKNLNTFYIDKTFDQKEFDKQTMVIEEETDLIIIDHAHYFDILDDNENRGFKSLVKHIREISQHIGKPVVLVSHIRKRDKKFPELCAGIDEFHGSSDLTKIATKIISIGRGNMAKNGNGTFSTTRRETFFRIPKNRISGSSTFYIGKTYFNFRTNDYDGTMIVGRLVDGDKKFEALAKEEYPSWAKNL